MAEAIRRGGWARGLSRLALVLSVGAVVAALAAALGSGVGLWPFGTGFGILRYAFYAAIVAVVAVMVSVVLSRRTDARTGRSNFAAGVISVLFGAYLGNQVATARSVPAIHDVATDLKDLPNFTTLTVRPDNLENIPDMDRPELAALDPESRWKAIHREAYGDYWPRRLSLSPAVALRRAETLARDRGWDVAKVDPGAGTIEATATTLFFRFKDDVVVRIRPDPARAGGSLVDMRSISRVGGSDVGVNAKRIRAFLDDLASA